MVDADLLERALSATGRLVAAVDADRLSAPTPCTEWTVRDLLNHVVGTTQMFAACARGDSTDWDPFAFPLDVVGDDVRQTYDAAAAEAVAAWRARGLDGNVTLPPGDVPAPVAITI